MDEMNGGITFRCSQEELAFLLALLGETTLAGFAGAPATDGVAEDTAVAQTIISGIVGRGLWAKGFVSARPDGQWVIDSALGKILRFCIYPQQVLALANRRRGAAAADEMQLELYYLLPALAVRQYQPLDGVYDFTLVQPPPDFAASITARIGELAPDWARDGLAAEPLPTGWTPQAAWSAAQVCVEQGDEAGAVALLQESGVDAAAAAAVVAALLDPALQLYLHLTAVDTAVTQHSLTLLLGAAQTLWAMWPTPPTGDQPPGLTFQTFNPNALKTELADLFAAKRETSVAP